MSATYFLSELYGLHSSSGRLHPLLLFVKRRPFLISLCLVKQHQKTSLRISSGFAHPFWVWVVASIPRRALQRLWVLGQMRVQEN